MKSILVPVEDHDSMGAVLETALLVARSFGSYIEGVPLGPDIAEMVAADFTMSGVIFDDRTRRAFLRHATETFETFMTGHAIPRRAEDSDDLSFGWMGETLVSPASIGEYGRLFDLIVVGRPGAASHEPHRSTLEAALFDSGRPLLIAPPRAPPTLGTTIAIAWNGSSETARTISFAMPLLARAVDVPVLAVPGVRLPGPGDGQIMRALRRHGVPARVVRVGETAKPPGRALLEAAAELGADLLIKGGYTQSRIRQMIFGSVTSDILAEASLPVFMAH
jgi:nucleotide-binding universal stress UspA family protein